MRAKYLLIIFLTVLFSGKGYSQINEDQLGAWYMYFFSSSIKEGPWGFQGDLQHRNWNIFGDLEQLMLRGGLTYSPKTADIKFTLGYARIHTGTFGEDNSTTHENRIYQEALFPNTIGGRFYLNHRFRYEQRFVEAQDFRTRYRYNLMINVPFNQKTLEKGAIYLSLYNELFINGQRDIGNGSTVEVFDRNRTYGAIGYSIKNNLRAQAGVMYQLTDTWGKTQIQFSIHHSFSI